MSRTPDALAGTAAAALALLVLRRAGPDPAFHSPDLLSYVLTGLGAGALALTRRARLPALTIAGCCAIVLGLRADHVDVLPFVITLMLFGVGYHDTRRWAWTVLPAVFLGLAATALARPPELGPATVVQSCVIFGVAWWLGTLLRSRRDGLLALIDSERDRAALLIVEERLRIARELHDVLTHSVSVISVQATVGEHLATRDPAAGIEALATIGTVSRATLQELRQILALLREDSDPGPVEPARSLADLDTLVETFRSAGLPAQALVHGDPRPLPASAELCAYRIIQEALTNTLKHAAARSAAIVLTYEPAALLLTVTDDGRGSAAAGTPGHGIVGMRERTALLGGTLHVGDTLTGGFQVQARIPYEAT
ncbi:MAG: sensor histidine kinase [Streptosporangiaceae bacterium]